MPPTLPLVCSGPSLAQPFSNPPPDFHRSVIRSVGGAQLPWRATYAQGVAPEVLLACEALAADFAGVGPLSSVGADVAFQDALLLCRVGAKRALVQLDGHHKNITFGVGEKQHLGLFQKRGLKNISANIREGEENSTALCLLRGVYVYAVLLA